MSGLETGSGSGENRNYSDCICTSNEASSEVLRPITIFSSFLSIFGSTLIILTFMMWRDVRRSLARQILLFLAIADLLGATGYFFGGILQYFLIHSEEQLSALCKVGSFWTTYFPVVSFFWTTYLAIYFAIALVLKRPNWTSKLMIPFHLTAWLIPLAICVVFVIIGWLGPNRSDGPCSTGLNQSLSQDAAGWCFVSSKIFEGHPRNSSFEMNLVNYFLVEAASGKMWELLAYSIVITCYVLIVIFNRCRWCKRDFQPHPMSPDSSLVEGASSYYAKQRISEAMASVDLKLMLVPAIFVFFRLWGTLRFFLFMVSDCTKPCEYNGTLWLDRSKDCPAYNHGLMIMQALFDPLQGFGNAVLFVLLSRVLLYRLYISFTRPFVRLWHCFTLCCQKIFPSTSYSNSSIEPDRAASIQSATSEKGILKVKYSPTQKKRITIEKENLEEDDLSGKHHKLAYGSMEQRTPLLASNQNTLQ